MYTSIAPYLYYMVEDFGYTDPSTISSICSIIISIFALGQALTGVVWGSLSDTYGRKPILICGIVGTALSTMMFGFSKSLLMACVSRFLAGVLNGNVGVMRTMIAEIVVDHKEYQTRAFAVMPMTFNIGTILGPVIGGLLADPAKNYPHQFWANIGIFKKYPYLLPNIFPMPLVCISLVVCILFLEETLEDDEKSSHESKIIMPKERDAGLKLGRKVVAWIKSKLTKRSGGNVAHEGYVSLGGNARDDISLHDGNFGINEHISMSSEDDERDVFENSTEEWSDSHESATRDGHVEIDNTTDTNVTQGRQELSTEEEHDESISFKDVLTKPVRVTIICYTLLMTHCPSFLQMLPLFMATPRLIQPDSKQAKTLFHSDHLPFVFNGGLGMPSARIGTTMAILGVTGISLQFLVYPRVAAWLGNARAHRYSLFFFPTAYVLVPFISLLTRHGYDPNANNGSGGENDTQGMEYRWSTTLSIVPVAILVVLGRTFSIPPMPVLITNAASSRKVLGKIHGLASSVTSVARCLGPFLFVNLYSIGVKIGMIGLAWWLMAALVVYEIYVARELKEWGSEKEDEEGRVALG